MSCLLKSLLFALFFCGFSCESVPADIQVRLVNGNHQNEGRVEVSRDGITWGTVCDDDFDIEEANTVCQQLFQRNAVYYRKRAGFGQGQGQIFLDDLRCSSGANFLKSCTSRGWASHNCRHDEDVGVICQNEIPADIQVRLINGNHQYEGRVEVSLDGITWGTVCGDDFDIDDANTVCQQLFQRNAVDYRKRAGFGQGYGPIFLDDLRCPSGAYFLNNCTSCGWTRHNCGHHQDVGVICQNDIPETKINVRLVGGTTEYEGRVEVSKNNVEWGTVCDDGFSLNDAHVVCMSLFQTRAVRHFRYAHFGAGSGKIFLDNLQCTGAEANLNDCRANRWGLHDCIHSMDAGVRCHQSQTTEDTFTPAQNEESDLHFLLPG